MLGERWGYGGVRPAGEDYAVVFDGFEGIGRSEWELETQSGEESNLFIYIICNGAGGVVYSCLMFIILDSLCKLSIDMQSWTCWLTDILLLCIFCLMDLFAIKLGKLKYVFSNLVELFLYNYLQLFYVCTSNCSLINKHYFVNFSNVVA